MVRHNYYATTQPRITHLMNTVAQLVRHQLSEHPTGASVVVRYAVTKYGSQLLTCAPDPQTLLVVLVAGRDGVAFTTITTTDAQVSFRIYDVAQAGHSPFDKDGYNLGSGGCQQTGGYQTRAQKVVNLS